MWSIVLLILLCSFPAITVASDATVHVTGQLLCDGKPYKNEKIEIYEKNTWIKDSLIISDKTDDNGYFSMKGTASDMFFNPVLYVYIPNYCRPVNKMSYIECAKTVKIYVPEMYLNQGHLAAEAYKIGELELSAAKTEQLGLETIVYSVFDHVECREIQ